MPSPQMIDLHAEQFEVVPIPDFERAVGEERHASGPVPAERVDAVLLPVRKTG